MPDDIARLRKEYEERKHRFATSDIYSVFNKATLFAMHQRQRRTLIALKKHNYTRLSDLRLLEIGCGHGRVLSEFLNFGAMSHNLYGLDLLAGSLADAREHLPASQFVNADGQNVPFPSSSFDLVLQYTALSSILDPQIRQQVARDMLRVLKPGGCVLWYDFWLNPANPQTHGIRPAEIQDLFPNCNYEFYKITLAPPLARRLVPISWTLALLFEGLRIFNTHYLVMILPKNESKL